MQQRFPERKRWPMSQGYGQRPRGCFGGLVIRASGRQAPIERAVPPPHLRWENSGAQGA